MCLVSCHFCLPACCYLLFSCLPGLQGGPHNHTITALATALKQAKAPEYIAYQKQVHHPIQLLETVVAVVVVPGMLSVLSAVLVASLRTSQC